MAQLLHLAKSAPEPVAPPAFIMTETAQDIMCSLRMIKKLSGPRMTAICGASGIGKTEAVYMHYSDDIYGIKMTVAPGESTEKHLSEHMATRCEVPDAWRLSLLQRRIEIVYRLGEESTLILDGAHHLSVTALEWACDLCAKAGCDLVLVGGVALNAALQSSDGLNSLATRKRVIPGVSAADVALLARAHGLDRDGIAGALEGVARHNGGLRNVMSVLEFARIVAGGAALSLGDVLTAIDQLGFPKGGK